MKLEGSLPRRVAGTLGFPSLDLSCLSLSGGGGGGCRCSTSQPGQDVLLLLLLLLLLLPGREKDCRAQRAPGTGRSQGVASRSPTAAGLPRAGALAAPLRSNEQAERGWEVINTSGKCGGGGGCDRCQAASGVGAPDWERGEGQACRGRGGRAGGGGAWAPRSRDPLEVRAEF